MVRTSENGGCRYPAVHSVPQSLGLSAQNDGLDHWAIFRLIDALAAYAFEGDAAGRRVALGHGSPEKIGMGSWPDGTPLTPLGWSADPEPVAAESHYMFPYAEAAKWAGEPRTEP